MRCINNSRINIQLLLTALILYGTGMQSAAQKVATISGLIHDAYTKAPIEGVLIQTSNSREISFTNEAGKFILATTAMLSDSLEASAIGYQKRLLCLQDLMSTTPIFLKPDIAQLRELTLVSGVGKPLQHISKLDIKMRGLNNAQEVLRMVPGLLIGQHAGGGKAEQIFLRGFDIDHGTDINITADGMPVNMVSHAHGQGYADLHFLIPELIEQVQFGKGPYNTTKGNMATAGYVELQTRDRLVGNSVKVEAGQFNTLRTLAMIRLLNGQQHKGKDLYVASEYLYSRGFFDAPQGFNRINVFTKYLQALGNHSQLSLSASTFSSRWNASGQIPDRAVESGAISFFGAIDPNEGGNTRRTNVNAQVRTELTPNAFIKNQLYYAAYDFDLLSNFTFFLNDPVNGDQIRQKERRNLFGYNGSYHHTGNWRDKTLKIEAGLTFRSDATSNSQLAHTLNRKTVLMQHQLGDIQEMNTAAYLQQTINWNDKLSSSAGLRMDHFYNQYKDKLKESTSAKNSAIVSPKMNLTYHLRKTTELYVSAGRGFHSNDTRVMVQTMGRKALPGAWGADLGLNTKPAKNLLLHVALWHLALQQEFVYVGDEGIVEPSGRTVRRGMDLSVRYQPFSKLLLDVDANFSDARFVDEPKGTHYVPLAPRFTSTGGVTYKSNIGWNGSLRYRWMGDRPANEDNSLVAKGYLIADASLAYTRTKWEWMLTAQNLFNARWKETQFETTSRLRNEQDPVTEIHFTPGTPFFVKTGFTLFF